MSIKANDLDKISQLIDLLDDWKTAAEGLGITLQEITVLPEGAYYAVRIGYEDDSSTPAYWSVNG